MTKIEIPYTTTPLSEYIGSHIYESIGLPVHETVLGVRQGKVVVACKDLLNPNEKIVDFAALKTRAVDGLDEKIEKLGSTTSGNGTDMEEIILIMENIPIFINNPLLVERFWDMFVIDGLIGNNDRNNGNWGIIRNLTDNSFVKICPVFDNGNSFSNKMGELRMEKILADPVKFKSSAIDSATSVFLESGKKINPFKYIESFKNEDLNQSILRIVPNIDLEKIKEIIYEIPNVDSETKIKITSDIQKEFYYEVLKARYEEILLPAYENLYNRELDNLIENNKIALSFLYDNVKEKDYFEKCYKEQDGYSSELIKQDIEESKLTEFNKKGNNYILYKNDNKKIAINTKTNAIISGRALSNLLDNSPVE